MLERTTKPSLTSTIIKFIAYTKRINKEITLAG